MKSSDSDALNRGYQELRSGAAIVDLAGWTSISVTGRDRQAFLHNFCTNDVKRLAPGECCEAFFTNVKGKIVGHGVISCKNDELVIFGAPSQASRLLEHLDRYVIREDVKLRDTTLDRNYLLVTDDELAKVEADERISWNLIGRDASSISELKPHEAAMVIGNLARTGFALVGPQAFAAARIEVGMPLYGVNFDDTNLPQEVGRDKEAISFTKGCYLGQETVARIDALGHVNQRLVGLRFFGSSVPVAGTELSRAGIMVVGHVTSATFSPKLAAPLALAMVRRQESAIGTRLDSPVGECEVIALPLS